MKKNFCDTYRVSVNQPRCILKNKCSNYGEACGEFCRKCYLFEYYVYESNIPERYKRGAKLVPSKSDLEAFKEISKIKSDMLNFVKEGESLLLYSDKCGNGKTTIACKLMFNFFLQASEDKKIYDVLFVNTGQIIADLKGSFGMSEDGPQIIKRVQKADLVVWDDIGATKYTETDISKLLLIFDSRYSNCKANIFTTNNTADSLRDKLGERLFSRVYNASKVIELIGRDKRGE